MIEVVGAFILGGAAGVVAKDKLLGNNQNSEAMKNELNSLYAENEKFSKRNKELERQVEDLLSELNRVRRQAKSNDDSTDNLEDELDKAKRELKNLRLKTDELARKVKAYKISHESLEAEIVVLKNKLG